MTIHREGFKMLSIVGVALILINVLLWNFFGNTLGTMIFLWVSVFFFLFLVSFFRIPRYILDQLDDQLILAPAEGRIVVIEEVEEPEYFKDKRIQVSIFMSPANVHVNRNPISGTVKYTKYHPGDYLVAWHPKSSTENERFTSVIECSDAEILVRQIAGKLARKISNYLDEGEQVQQGGELGFIKLGSRVDIFLPLNAKVKVKLEERVKGGKTVIAELVKMKK